MKCTDYDSVRFGNEKNTSRSFGVTVASCRPPRGIHIMKSREILLILIMLLIASFAAPGTSFAQDDSLAIEEVVVTAQRVETNLMTTSLAVSAFDQDTLTKNGVKDIRDAADLVPNFDVAFSPVDSGVQLTIRGINSNNFTEIGDPSVAFHVDGIYSPRPQGATALMFDLERLEVMRGPQGTLFGRNSAAGSVNVITAKPSMEGVFGTFGAEMGNRNQFLALGTLNVPLSDTFAVRANFFAERRDGHTDQDSGTKDLEGIGNQGPDGIPDMDQRWNHSVSKSDRYGNADRWAARVSAMWIPTDRLDLRLTVESAKDENAGWPAAPNCDNAPDVCQYNGGGIDYADPNVPGLLDMTNDAVRANVNFALTEDINLVYNFGWANQERFQQYDADMGWRAVPGPNTGWLNRNPPWGSLHFFTTSSRYESYINELQFQGLTSRVNWILGFFSMQEDNDIHFDVELPFDPGDSGLNGSSFIQPDRTLESNAIFGQATWHITDQWHLTLGYRYYEDEKKDVGGRNYSCTNGVGCSFSAGAIPRDGHPVPGSAAEDELLLPQFTSADLGPGMGRDNPLANYNLDAVNDNRQTFDDGTWRVGLDWDLNDETFLYSYVATGSKAGGFQDGIDVCRCGRIEFIPYEPEEVTNYEIGYKASLWEGRMNLIVTAFRTDFENKQVSSFRTVGVVEDPPGVPAIPVQEIQTFVTDNAADAKITGLEIEWDVIPWENGRITGGLGILDTEIKEWRNYRGEDWFCDEREEAGPEFACIPVDDGTGVNSPAGNELPYAAPISFTMAYEHVFDLVSGATVTPFVKFHWEDDMHMTEGNFDGVARYSDLREAFGTLDASVRYTSPTGAWSVEGFVYNATDERFPTFAVGGIQPGVPLFAWNGPRSWGVRANYNISP